MIEKREKTEVKITNGQDNATYSITLGDFIPFYFGVKMPMLYAIQYGVNLAEKVHASEIIYLVCSVKKILNLQVEYYFSDGHAINVLTSFYDYNCINQIDTILDWEAIHANYWGGEENLDLKRKKQAEFLIKNDLPKEVIIKYICYDEKSKKN